MTPAAGFQRSNCRRVTTTLRTRSTWTTEMWAEAETSEMTTTMCPTLSMWVKIFFFTCLNICCSPFCRLLMVINFNRSGSPLPRRTNVSRASWEVWRRTLLTPGTTRYAKTNSLNFFYLLFFSRLRRRWTRSTRRMWSRAETSTRPWGRWGKATRKGEWTSSRTCKPRTKGLASHAWVLKTINCDQFRPPKKLLSLSDRMSECCGYEWHFKKQIKARNRNRPQELQST